MALAHFTTLVPIQAGREEALRKTLDALGTDDQSPFHGVPGTHMARFYVLDHYGGSLTGPVAHHQLRRALLVLSAVVDGPVGIWVGNLHQRMEPTAEAVWSHCFGFPGTADGRAFARWLLRHQVPPSFDVIANKEGSVQSVREGLTLRTRLGEFAGRMQGVAPPLVRDAYREWFGR